MSESKHQPQVTADADLIAELRALACPGTIQDSEYDRKVLALTADRLQELIDGTPTAALTPGLVEELRREVERLRAACEAAERTLCALCWEHLSQDQAGAFETIMQIRAALKGETP